MTPLVLNTGIEEVRKHSTWFLVIGIALVILGMIAIGYAVEMTIVSVIFLGWLLILGGLFEIIHGFSHRPWSGFFINLLAGVLYAVAGFVMVSNPAAAAVTLTLLIAIDIVRRGRVPPLHRIFDAIASSRMAHPQRRDSILLGFTIWDSWPVSGLWVIGMFIGIDMVFDGWTEIMLALERAQTAGVEPGCGVDRQVLLKMPYMKLKSLSRAVTISLIRLDSRRENLVGSKFSQRRLPFTAGASLKPVRYHQETAKGLPWGKGRLLMLSPMSPVVPGSERMFIPKYGSGSFPLLTSAETTVDGTEVRYHAEASKPAVEIRSPVSGTLAED